METSIGSLPDPLHQGIEFRRSSCAPDLAGARTPVAGHRAEAQFHPQKRAVSLGRLRLLATAGAILASCLSLVGSLLAVVSMAQSENRAGKYADYFDAPTSPGVRQRLYILKRFHLDRATAYFEKGSLDAALKELNFVFSNVPNHVEALILNDSIARLRRTPELALFRYQQAIKLYPNHAVTHLQMGAFQVDAGQTDAGIERLRVALTLDPKLGLAYAYLAKAYAQEGDLLKAQSAEAEAKRYGVDNARIEDLLRAPEKKTP